MPNHHVCPWYIGYFLANPLRRLVQDPHAILASYVKSGMRVLEVGPGMGFFTLPMAGMVGPSGRIFAVDIQERMLRELRKRAERARLAGRVECRQATAESLGIDDLPSSIDFTLLMAVVHEVPSMQRLFAEVRAAMRPGGRVLMADPKSRFSQEDHDLALVYARGEGLNPEPGPEVWRSRSAVLVRG